MLRSSQCATKAGPDVEPGDPNLATESSASPTPSLHQRAAWADMQDDGSDVGCGECSTQAPGYFSECSTQALGYFSGTLSSLGSERAAWADMQDDDSDVWCGECSTQAPGYLSECSQAPGYFSGTLSSWDSDETPDDPAARRPCSGSSAWTWSGSMPYSEPNVDPSPDTDSEYGDNTAVRATWRMTDGLAAQQPWPTGEPLAPPPVGSVPVAGGAVRAPDDFHEPQSSLHGDHLLRSPAAVQERRCRGRKARVIQTERLKMISRAENLESITTVMVRNLPVRCGQDGNSMGFAFVNFKMSTVAPHFVAMWHGSQRFSNHSDSRALQVTAAHIQGFEANLSMALQGRGIIRNRRFRPLVFAEYSSTGRALPPAPPAAPPPVAPPQLSGQAEAAGPQDPPGTPCSARASTSLHAAAPQPASWKHVGWNPHVPLQRPPGVFAR